MKSPDEMNGVEAILSQPGGYAIMMDLLHSDDREPGDSLICDFLPGMREEYDRIKKIVDQEIAKMKENGTFKEG